MYIFIWQSLQLWEATNKKSEKERKGLFIKCSQTTISENYFSWILSDKSHGFLELQIAVSCLLKTSKCGHVKTKLSYPIYLDVIRSEKSSDVGSIGEFHYENRTPEGVINKKTVELFCFFPGYYWARWNFEGSAE